MCGDYSTVRSRRFIAYLCFAQISDLSLDIDNLIFYNLNYRLAPLLSSVYDGVQHKLTLVLKKGIFYEFNYF
jgi:hypothetical protein